MVRRTNPVGSPLAIDLGRLAEAMLFYQNVSLALTHETLNQFILGMDPDLAIELVSDGAVDAVYIDRFFAVNSRDAGAPTERHQPATVQIMLTDPAGRVQGPQTRYDLVHELFGKAYDGSPRKARRKANRFLNHVRDHTMSFDLQSIASTDWQREEFMREAVCLIIGSLAPGYTPPADLQIALVDHGDGYYRFEGNLDWAAVRAGHTAATGVPSDFGPGSLLVMIMDMLVDLHLGAALDATISQNRLGDSLMRAKCADLATTADLQQTQIDRFQQLVVDETADIAGAINLHGKTFEEFLAVQQKAKPFREWLDGQTADADLVRAFGEEMAKKHGISALPGGELRWTLPVLGDASATVIEPHLAAAVSAGLVAYGLLDKFMIERYFTGWRPASFIDKQLRPFVKP